MINHKQKFISSQGAADMQWVSISPPLLYRDIFVISVKDKNYLGPGGGGYEVKSFDIITVTFINPTIITVFINHIHQNKKRHARLHRFLTPHDLYQTQVWKRRRQLWHCDHQQWHRGGLRRVSGFSESAIPKLDLDTEAMFNFRLWNQIEYFSKSTKAFRPPKKVTAHLSCNAWSDVFFSSKPINISLWNYV